MIHARFGLVLLFVSCSGLVPTVNHDVPMPHRLAVLPVQGAAPFAERELARSLLQARLQERGYLVAELPFVDRVLSERFSLADPETFAPKALPVSEVASALGVDGLLIVDRFDETRWNIVILRRHVLGGRFSIVASDGREWFVAEHTVGATGGFLLKSGQVLAELMSQSAHGTGAASIDRIDELIGGVAAALPADADRHSHVVPPDLEAPVLTSAVTNSPVDGLVRVDVVATSAPFASVWFDLGDVHAVPMAGKDGVFTGAVHLPADEPVGEVRLRARSAFGRVAETNR